MLERFLAWFRSLLSGTATSAPQKPRVAQPERRAAPAAPTAPTSKSQASASKPNAPASTPSDVASAARPVESALPEPAAPLPRRLHNLDTSERARTRLRAREEEILKAVEQALDNGRLELPNLPATSAAVMQIVGKSNADVAQIVALISTDPVLSSELLKTANSVLYAGAVPTETLQAAVVRIGMRNLRMLILTVSLRGAVLSDRSLALYAEEVWRQSYTMAWIARSIAKPLGFDPDKAFLMTLVADIGKVPLLAELSREMRRASLRPSDISPALVGGVFHAFHERAGSLLAKAWHMSDEFISVAGCHHAYDRNTQNREGAALVSLAQRIDMALTHGDDEAPAELVHAPEFAVFTLAEARRWDVVQMAQAAHTAAGAEVASAAAA